MAPLPGATIWTMSASSAPSDAALTSTEAQRSGRGSGGVTGRGFRPGVSGNPGGVPKDGIDIAALARSHAPEAIAALVRGLNDPKHYVHAAQVLLDRGFGKPTQPLTSDGPPSLSVLHLVAAREISERMQQAVINGTALPPADDDTTAVEQTPNAQLPSVDLSVPALE
jgi:hypothetical protein